tara:strand:+ start:303 stop:905 length:603 start_codon:yes stop_codon:yes gene_type:complete
MTITNEDNMNLMSRYEDNYFDLAIVDPPFPINTNGGGKMRTLMRAKDWDDSIPKKEYFEELKRVSKNYIICGGNFFTEYLEPNNKWIIWHKNHAGDKTNFSEAEMFYSTCKGNTRVFKHSIIGRSLDWHACPKPIKLYEWLLMNYAKEGDKILDTHLGSGSIAIACHNLGYDLTACELDKDYFDAAIKRLKQHQAQLTMF